MKKSYLVIGLGRFGANVARALEEMHCDVLAIDIKEECVKQISQDVPHCLIADSTKINVLHELGASNVDYAVVAIGNNLQASILTVVNLKNLENEQICNLSYLKSDLESEYGVKLSDLENDAQKLQEILDSIK